MGKKVPVMFRDVQVNEKWTRVNYFDYIYYIVCALSELTLRPPAAYKNREYVYTVLQRVYN